MSSISVRHSHNLDAAEARRRIGLIEDKLGQYGIKLSWSGNDAKISGLGVSGSASVGQGSVEIKLKLGMIARAAGVDAKRLQSAIEKRVDKAFADEPPQELI